MINPKGYPMEIWKIMSHLLVNMSVYYCTRFERTGLVQGIG